MKLYCVFAIEYHVRRELVGVYDSRGLAEIRKSSYKLAFYDAIEIFEYELNEDIE